MHYTDDDLFNVFQAVKKHMIKLIEYALNPFPQEKICRLQKEH